MDLKTVFSAVGQRFPAKKEKTDLFLAVKISSQNVLATVWTITQDKVEIGEIGTAKISAEDFDSLLHASDQAVSQVSQNSKEEVNKVIFAIPYNWTQDGKLHPEKLAQLRRLSKELDLTPLGFVLTAEALENFFKEVEGAPLTAILINIDNDQSVLTLYRAGKDLGTVPLGTQAFSQERIVEEIEKALKNFPQLEALPARIVLYDGVGDLEKVAQKITAHPWTGKLPFLHFPKVEKIPADFVVKAVAAAGGMQMGAKLDMGEIEEYRHKYTTPSPEASPIYHTGESQPPADDSIQLPEVEEVDAADAGFVAGSFSQDVSLPLPSSPQEEEPAEQISFSNLAPPEPASATNLNVPVASSESQVRPSIDMSKFLTRISGSVGTFIAKTRTLIIQPSQPKSPGPPAKTLSTKLISVVILILLLGAILFSVTIYLFPKAEVLLTVNTKQFQHEMTVGITTDTSSATEGKTISGSFVDTQEIGSKKGVTTGKKLVGDKAKGTATIYSVSGGKTFPQGQVVTSPDGLKFTLSRDVSVASGDAISPSTVTVEVLAASIGDSYNLPSGTRFTLDSFSSSEYLAKNDSAFTGGSSHQATVVTKADQDRLMATLSAQLAQQANANLQAKVQPNQTLLPNAVTAQISKKKFSKDIDQETDTLSLDLTMNFRGVVFSKDEVTSLFVQEYSSDIPQGYNLSPDSTNVEVKDAKTDKKGNTTLTINLSAIAKPKFDVNEIAKNISGKNLQATTAYLKGLPGVATVSLNAKPSIFKSLFQIALPWKKDNIKVAVITE